MIHTRTLRRSRKGGYLIIAGTAAICLLFLAGVTSWYQFFRDDAPAPVSLEGAISTIDDATPTASSPALATATTTETSAVTNAANATPEAPTSVATEEATATTEPPTATTASSAGLDGDWVIDTSLETFVGYRVGEELASIGTTEAVGRTSSVTGAATVSGTTVSSGSFEADLTTLDSDESMRDGQLGRQAIETDTFPTATFVLTEPLEIDAAMAAGSAIQAVARGDLTLHGVTNAVEIPLDLQLVDGVIVVVGSLDIMFADYNIEQPTSMRVLSVDDHGVLEFQLFFARA